MSLKEKLYVASVDIEDMEERISNTVNLPVYFYGNDERVWDDIGEGAVSYNSLEKLYDENLYEENLYDTEVRSDSTDIYGGTDKEANSVLSVAKSDINGAVEVMHEDIYGKMVYVTDSTEKVPVVTGMVVEPMIVTIEETIIDKMVIENAVTENVVAEVFDFQVDNSKYNLKLYFAVMKSVGITKSVNEMYEDY